MNEELKEAIFEGEYKKAFFLINRVPFRTAEQMLFTLSYDTESISICFFVEYLYLVTNEIKWLRLNISLLLNPFCYLEGAYSSATFLLKKIIDIEHNPIDLETLLFIFDSPENTLKHEDGVKYAKMLLEIEKDNMIAKKVLGLI